MSVRNILMATAGSSGSDKLYVDDVFSAYTYTGNSSTQTINNGIDLAGEGGLVWLKARELPNSHCLLDTIRGGSLCLLADNSSGNLSDSYIPAFGSSGFDVIGNDGAVSYPGYNYISWTFRKAPKFFDVVQYTGNGVNYRQIAHSLGTTPGMVIIKAINSTGDWYVNHRSLSSAGDILRLNTTDQVNTGVGHPAHTSTQFTISSGNSNLSGSTYVAYLFAHDTDEDGMIQCGSVTSDASGNGATILLPWEPQYIMYKCASTSHDWYVVDNARGSSYSGRASLYPNLSNAEFVQDSTRPVEWSPSGVKFVAGGFINSQTYIYLAIRRPNKPPTTGTQVYNAVARTGTDAAATVTGVGFAPDAVIGMARSVGGATYSMFVDRLRGASKYLKGGATSAEVNDAANSVTSFGVDGFSIENGASFSWPNQSPYTYINWAFRRAPGVFDVVCDTGTGSAHAIAHSLAVVPELMIRKKRSDADNWVVYAGDATDYLILNSTAATADLNTMWNDTAPTASAFTVGTSDDVNQSAGTFVTYLFATLPGISKVGSYTGNGSSQTIDCGFSTGARFVLIKRTDGAGDWYIWDTARGIVAANDPHLSLNTTAAEVTTNDSVDPDANGFIVNQVAATNVNVTGATYIFLAVS